VVGDAPPAVDVTDGDEMIVVFDIVAVGIGDGAATAAAVGIRT
jgi:hypothetical protein